MDSFVSNKTLDANAFMKFVANIESRLKYMTYFNYFNYNEVSLLMDNSSIHKKLWYKDTIMEAKMKIMYIPWYHVNLFLSSVIYFHNK